MKGMTVTNFRRKVRKLVFKRYDLLENGVKKLLKDYGLQRLPLVTFNELADRMKFGPADIKDLEKMGNFCEHFNTTVDLMKGFARDNADTFNDDHVSLKEVSDWIAAAKKGFIDGQNGTTPAPKN